MTDLSTFYCGNCKKFKGCGKPYPSTGKPVKDSDTACMSSFELGEVKIKDEVVWQETSEESNTWVETVMLLDALRDIGKPERKPYGFL